MFYRPRRIPSDAKITLVIGNLKLTARLLDVSEQGLKIKLDEVIPVGTKIRLQGTRLDLAGEIRWSNGREAGLALDRVLSRTEQAELSGAVWVS